MTKIIKGEGLIVIDGERLGVSKIHNYGYLPELYTDGGEYIVAESREEAGRAARRCWVDEAQDAKNFACLVGQETLIAWALGQSAGPGCVAVNSLQEWLDLWLDIPEEQWASYDGVERWVDAMTQDVADELGWSGDFDAVAYRHN